MDAATQLIVFFGGFTLVVGVLLFMFRQDIKGYISKANYPTAKDSTAFLPTCIIEKRVCMGGQVFQEIHLTCSAKTYEKSLHGVQILLEVSKKYDPNPELHEEEEQEPRPEIG